MLKIEMTKEEAQNLAGLLDIAVKSGGMQVAGAALMIMRKVEEAARVLENKVQE